MHTATVSITGLTPYSSSRHYYADKLNKESARDYESRTWRERLHYNDVGEVYIPSMAFKNCLSDVAKYLSVQIPGKGKATYRKHIEAGVMVLDPLMLGIKKDDVVGEWVFVPSDGVRGSGKRVDKCFPKIAAWGGELQLTILDDTVTRDVLEMHLKEAGRFIGVGRFRPRNNGFYGRFEAAVTTWV